MKRKLFIFVLACAFIVSTAVCLTACGGDKNSKDAQTLSYLSVEYDGNVYMGAEYGVWLGDFKYGTTPNLDYKIYASYSDGSKKELQKSDYTVAYVYSADDSDDETIESLPNVASQYQIGCYSIKIQYQSKSAKINFNIKKGDTNYTTGISKTAWRYGDTQPNVSVFGYTGNTEDLQYYYIDRTSVADPDNATDDELFFHGYSFFPNATYDTPQSYLLSPGEYYIYTIVPETEKYVRTYSSLVAVTVQKGLLTVKQDVLSTFTARFSYDYSDTFGNFTADRLYIGAPGGDVSQFTNPRGEEVFLRIHMKNTTEELNSSNNGETRKAVFDPDELYEVPDQYKEIDIILDIEKGKVDYPDILMGGSAAEGIKIDLRLYSNNVSNVNVIYKGTDPDSEGTNVNVLESIDENNIFTLETLPNEDSSFGTYYCTVSLKDKDNYEWYYPKDENDPTADLTLHLEINSTHAN